MTTVLMSGEVRIVYRNANDVEIATLMSKRLDEFGNVAGTANTDPQKMPKIKKGEGNGAIVLSQDDKLVIKIYLDTAVTENATSSVTKTIRVPITYLDVKTGGRYEKTLGYSDFTVITAFGNSKVWPVSIWNDMLKYTIPAQTQVQLGHRVQDVRVDSAVNLGFDVTT